LLKELIRIIHDTGFIEKGMIAKQLGFSIETVEDALNLLISKGYLSRDSIDASGGGCVGCSKSCSTELPGIVYKLTEKGRNYAFV
jgi:hypothetical protein